ncbi:PDDEXK nuclease domain-containing protein [Methanolapillus africanus]
MKGDETMSHDIIPYADAIIHMIEESRLNVLKSVNAELIKLYWRVGEYLSNESSKSLWGSSFIDETARRIRENNPEIKGFDRRNLYRMKQFYETYKDNEFVSPLVTQISWTNHLLILSNTKSMEEKEFYIKLCLQEKYSKRELERQFGSCYYERYLLSSKKTASTMLPENIKNGFFDKYVLEFLDLPDGYSENDFKKAIIQNLKNFLLELGRDFSFIGEEYRIQVGDTDFYIDLLFYHRALSCLVAFELKIDNFKPEYLGKMNFYLESLDREHKKPNENPSIGVILCATKNDEIVEYAMSKSLSPALVSEYTLQLIDKKLLERKLREFKELIPENKTDILNK